MTRRKESGEWTALIDLSAQFRLVGSVTHMSILQCHL